MGTLKEILLSVPAIWSIFLDGHIKQTHSGHKIRHEQLETSCRQWTFLKDWPWCVWVFVFFSTTGRWHSVTGHKSQIPAEVMSAPFASCVIAAHCEDTQARDHSSFRARNKLNHPEDPWQRCTGTCARTHCAYFMQDHFTFSITWTILFPHVNS